MSVTWRNVPLSEKKGTTLEEDQAEMELVGEIWCRLGKERLRRGMNRHAEECCGYVNELLPQVQLTARSSNVKPIRSVFCGR